MDSEEIEDLMKCASNILKDYEIPKCNLREDWQLKDYIMPKNLPAGYQLRMLNSQNGRKTSEPNLSPEII